jgi:hypothetical protein
MHVLPRAWMAAPVAVSIVGCGPTGSAPIFETHEDVTAQPGMELYVQLRAIDDDGDELRFAFVNDDLEGIHERAEVRTYANGNAMFHYVPVVSDLGDHAFTFIVTDESGQTDEQTLWISVVTGGTSAPVFLEPIGAGTTIDPTRCLNLDVEVDDPDTPEVALTQEAPFIDGANLDRQSGHSAIWLWCPSAGQRVAQSTWALTLGADDGEHPVSLKSFLIVYQ